MELVDKLFKEEQITFIHINLNIPKSVVKLVLTDYVSYLKEQLSKGNSIKFLNVCYLVVKDSKSDVHETLAYIATEISKRTGVSVVTTQGILFSYEEVVTANIAEGVGITVRGLVRIKKEGGKVRTKKSTTYNGYNIYITTLPSFKRKVENAA